MAEQGPIFLPDVIAAALTRRQLRNGVSSNLENFPLQVVLMHVASYGKVQPDYTLGLPKGQGRLHGARLARADYLC